MWCEHDWWCWDRTSPVLSLVQLFGRALQALDLLAGLHSDVLQLVPQFVLVLGLIVIPGGETDCRFDMKILDPKVNKLLGA